MIFNITHCILLRNKIILILVLIKLKIMILCILIHKVSAIVLSYSEPLSYPKLVFTIKTYI